VLFDLVFSPCPAVPADGRLLAYRLRGDRAPVAEAGALGLRAGADRALLVLPGDDGLAYRNHPVAVVRLADALPALLAPRRAVGVQSASVAGYVRAARLAAGLVAEQQIAPVLRDVDGTTVASWQVLLPAGGVAADTLVALADTLPPAAHALPRDTAGVWHPFALLRAFVDAVADVLVRNGDDTGDGQRTGRPRARLLPWTARWQEAATDPLDPTVPLRAERGEVLAGVREWLRPYEQPRAAHTPELILTPPDGAEGAWLLRFGLRDRDGTSVPATDIWSDDEASSDRVEALLEALARAARVFPPIEEVLDEARPAAARLDNDAAWRFIDQTAPLLTDAGYVVALPDTVDELRPRLQLGTPDDHQLGGTVAVQWQGTVGDRVVDADVVDRLVDDEDPLVFWEDRWVRVTPEARAQWRARGWIGGRVPLIEAIGLAVAGVGPAPGTAPVADVTQVSTVGPLATLVDRLREGAPPRARTVPDGFVGDLRAYQLDAVGWLGMMRELGLGAVLADDMGLGKTVMLIAHLLGQRSGPHLVVCPTSVVTNWERELGRFAPDLAVRRHHGPDRADDLRGVSDVVVTSYGTLRRDIDLLADVAWQVVALDEAQQVKNPDTLGAKAVRRLRSAHGVALTGTPVENRLRELWSVLDLTNAGLLGSRGAFERRFANPIERRGDHAVRTQLRRLIAPFVLRRTKADPRVAPELPPRIERTVPCTMTEEQRDRYAAAVERFRREAERPRTGMEHRGAVLALLTRLKQICDHPTLGTDAARAVGRSGKLAVTRQLIAEAGQAGERVLVFTQFVGMARILVDDLSHALQTDVPVLHGGMSATARQQVVDRFQGETDDEAPPVLVASLRAGGTGMNLTAATQVIHYDRWWNPAVEDQASDRAHRIGQTERVLIHRLMMVGTLEERIDALLESKREMASAIVGAGETWITELELDALLELVELGDTSGAGGKEPVLVRAAADDAAGGAP
jgi:hypothetical protein